MVDVLIVAALQEELDARVRRLFHASEVVPPAQLRRACYQAQVQTRGGQRLALRLMVIGGKGAQRTAAAVSRAISIWNPARVIMIGIAAVFPSPQGTSGDRRRQKGDILVAESIVPIPEMKILPDGSWIFRPDKSVACDPMLVSIARDMGEPRVHVGGIVSQPNLVRSAPFRGQLQSHVDHYFGCNAVIGLEMEGGGLVAAIEEEPPGATPGVLLVKGAVDWASYGKNDKQHKSVPVSVARFVLKLLAALPSPSSIPQRIQTGATAPPPSAKLTVQSAPVGGAQPRSRLKWLHARKNPTIRGFPGIGWGDALSLQDHPEIARGWSLDEIAVDPIGSFGLDSDLSAAFHKYMSGRHPDPGRKLMLDRNPVAFSDAGPDLHLPVRHTTFDQMCYFRTLAASSTRRRNALIERFVRGDLRCRFAHGLCLHTVIITKDRRLLFVKRSPKVHFSPGTWSCSVEEQMQGKDLVAGPGHAAGAWARRLLIEELGLLDRDFETTRFRVLSVFLEADCLNVSLCAVAEIGLTSDELKLRYQVLHLIDREFTEIRFVPLRVKEILSELRRPKGPQHPTTGIRLLYVLLHYFGDSW